MNLNTVNVELGWTCDLGNRAGNRCNMYIKRNFCLSFFDFGMEFLFSFSNIALVEIIWSRGTVFCSNIERRKRERETKCATILANLMSSKATNKNEKPMLQSSDKRMGCMVPVVVHILCTYAHERAEQTKRKGGKWDWEAEKENGSQIFKLKNMYIWIFKYSKRVIK